jgi:Ca2+:H+ antiporter
MNDDLTNGRGELSLHSPEEDAHDSLLSYYTTTTSVELLHLPKESDYKSPSFSNMERHRNHEEPLVVPTDETSTKSNNHHPTDADTYQSFQVTESRHTRRSSAEAKMHFLTVRDPIRAPSLAAGAESDDSHSAIELHPHPQLKEVADEPSKTADMKVNADEANDFSWAHVSYGLLTGSKLNILLLCGPFAVISKVVGWSDGLTFFACVFGLIPLAAMLGDCTEQLANHTNQTIGGLLNATFGNATELIISIFALRNGLLRIIQVSLLGSIISNMLLVLGTSFIAGGLKYKMQRFNKNMVSTNSGLLLLAVIGLLLPAVLNASGDDREDIAAELILSRGSAILLLGTYCAYIAFQLLTHRHLFEDGGDAQEQLVDRRGSVDLHPSELTPKEEAGDEEEEEETMTLAQSIFFLAVVTTLVSILSEFAVDAIEGAAKTTGLPQIFIGAIILPIVGNAAEHATAITVAYRNKMTLSLGVAIGSSTQVALFGIPFMILVAWMSGEPLSMYFRAYETAVVFSTVVILSFVVADGKSTWLKGLMLLVAYFIVAIGFFVHKDD